MAANDATPMMRIAVTPPDIMEDEPRRIMAILDAGWDKVHLRHPSATLSEMRRLIEAIPQRMHGRLRLHGHFELLNEFNLGGIQLNSRCPVPPTNYTGRYSRSCHTVEETRATTECDYVTLSPIFDSISKQGYHSEFRKEDFAVLPTGKVIALGGVTPDNTATLRQYPFAGYAVLGYLFGVPFDEFARRLQQFDN